MASTRDWPERYAIDPRVTVDRRDALLMVVSAVRPVVSLGYSSLGAFNTLVDRVKNDGDKHLFPGNSGFEQLLSRTLGVPYRRPDALVHVLDLRMSGNEPYSQFVLHSDTEENTLYFDRGGVSHWNPRLLRFPRRCCRRDRRETVSSSVTLVDSNVHGGDASEAAQLSSDLL